MFSQSITPKLAVLCWALGSSIYLPISPQMSAQDRDSDQPTSGTYALHPYQAGAAFYSCQAADGSGAQIKIDIPDNAALIERDSDGTHITITLRASLTFYQGVKTVGAASLEFMPILEFGVGTRARVQPQDDKKTYINFLHIQDTPMQDEERVTFDIPSRLSDVKLGISRNETPQHAQGLHFNLHDEATKCTAIPKGVE